MSVSSLSERPVGAVTQDAQSLPLCVDLDGTLLRVDTLHEAAVAATVADPRVAFKIPFWLARGKAVLKRELALLWRFDPARLPYKSEVVERLRTEKAAGRRLVLVTAADRAIAEPIADHLALFDEVIASDGRNNLKGVAKADALVHRFGSRGFVYMGNDRADLHVFAEAAAAIVVDGGWSVEQTAKRRFGAEILHTARRPVVWSALRAMRPHQWLKNILCLLPYAAAGGPESHGAFGNGLMVMLAFSLFASATYLLNDISDLDADRAHRNKRRRALAAGDLPVAIGLVLSVGLALAALGLAAVAGGLLWLLIYAAIAFAYTAKLKELPLVDIFLLTSLYDARMMAGGDATGNPVSVWLLGFASFLFLSLALVKRVSELIQLPAGTEGQVARRGYRANDVLLLQMLGVGSTFASAVVLALYVSNGIGAKVYANPRVLWGFVPLMLFWQCRLWLATNHGEMHDDPIVYAARDRWSQLVVLGLALCVALAHLPGSWLPALR
ncbi:MAG TPA: UbiA family prenyltransferase [Stellaceae bacterium]|nr:UbiA family prenyltransferase [Stellaceae bacterium]